MTPPRPVPPPEPPDDGDDRGVPAPVRPRRRPPVDAEAPEVRRARALPGAARVLRERWDILVVIAAGGALGSLARWSLTVVLPHSDAQIPWATWWANITGAFALGVLMVFVLDVWPPHRYVRPFLGVGVLGGYTTYSTLMDDSRALAATGRPGAALGYLGGSVLAGLVAVWVGVLLARALVAVDEARRRRRHTRAEPADREADPERDADMHPDLDTDPGLGPDVRSRR